LAPKVEKHIAWHNAEMSDLPLQNLIEHGDRNTHKPLQTGIQNARVLVAGIVQFNILEKNMTSAPLLVRIFGLALLVSKLVLVFVLMLVLLLILALVLILELSICQKFRILNSSNILF